MTILAAVGGEYPQDRVVEVGNDLATAYEDDLTVLHVMEQDRFEELRGGSNISAPVVIPSVGESVGIAYRSSEPPSGYDLEDGMTDAESVAQECVSRTLSEAGEATVSVEGRVGDPATEVVEEANRIDARYIVVGGRKRSPTGKALFGSVSQSIILNSELPVVTITRNMNTE